MKTHKLIKVLFFKAIVHKGMLMLQTKHLIIKQALNFLDYRNEMKSRRLDRQLFRRLSLSESGSKLN